MDEVDDRVDQVALDLQVALEVGRGVEGDERHVVHGVDDVALGQPLLMTLVKVLCVLSVRP